MSSTHSSKSRTRLLKTQTALHILILTITLFLLMQLIAHISASQGVENFAMPKRWKREFVGQLVQGSKMFSWVGVFVLVPADLAVAVGYLGGKDAGKMRNGSGRKRRTVEKCVGSACRKMGGWKEKIDKHSNDDTQPASHNNNKLPHVLFPHLSPLKRLLLNIIWHVLVILALTSHIYIFLTNIHPSREFCATAGGHLYRYTHYDFEDPGKTDYQPKLTLEERCERINSSIHTAGGCSAGSAGVLGLLHFIALILGCVEYWCGRKKERKGEEGEGDGVEMQDWAYAPRDIDVRSRKSSIRDGQEGGETGHVSTISQEEANVGVRRRGRRDTESGANVVSGREGGKWGRWRRSEGWFECLLE